GANWYKLIKGFLTDKLNMTEVLGWPCVFMKRKDKQVLIICLFVDDMILFTNSNKMATDAIELLKTRFATKVINDGKGNTINKYDILGMEIEYVKNHSMKFGMEKSLEEKLPTLGIDLSKLRKVPGTPGLIIEKEDIKVTKQEYNQKVKWMQQIIGLASYVGYKYRFDLLYYINVLARHTLYPSGTVIQLAKELIQYLWNTRGRKLIWLKSNNSNTHNKLDIICDASFANQENFKSQYGHIIKLNDNIIAGTSSKSTITCSSSTEAELYSVSQAIPQFELLTALVKEIEDKTIELKLISDSQPGIASMKNNDEKIMKKKFYAIRLLRLKEEIKERISNSNILTLRKTSQTFLLNHYQ
ncbi:Ty1/Copia family ribonuclease HI NDAI_0B00750, partial [Naumovozyma dairenensis CBS 421]